MGASMNIKVETVGIGEYNINIKLDDSHKTNDNKAFIDSVSTAVASAISAIEASAPVDNTMYALMCSDGQEIVKICQYNTLAKVQEVMKSEFDECNINVPGINDEQIENSVIGDDFAILYQCNNDTVFIWQIIEV